MNYLLILLFVPLGINFLVEWSGLIDSLKYWLFYRQYTKQTQYRFFRIKPLDCPPCASYWTSFIYLAITSHLNLFEMIIYSLASAAIALIINKVVNRL